MVVVYLKSSYKILIVGFGVKHNNDIIDTVHEEEVKDIKSVLRFYWKLMRFKLILSKLSIIHLEKSIKSIFMSYLIKLSKSL